MSRGDQRSASPMSPAEELALDLSDERLEWPPKGNTYFIPRSAIHRYVTKEAVRKVLREIFPKWNAASLNHASLRISTEAPRLFTILLLCGRNQTFCSKIEDFLDNDITDEKLPLARIYPPGSIHYTLGTNDHKECERNHEGNCEIEMLSSWRRNHIEDLCRDQWLVLAPVFTSYDNYVQHYDLDESTIFPYIKDQKNDRGAIKIGGYSRVWGVKMHPAHQFLLPSTDSSVSRKSRKKHRRSHRTQIPTIAVKQLDSQDPEHFGREYKMLSQLARKKDKHLIRLLATYTFQNQYHFLFAYANHNLKSYWEKYELNWKAKEDVFWVLQQLLGLASALHVIHEFRTAHKLESDYTNPEISRRRPAFEFQIKVDENEEYFGRHGDLKPENILWFKEGERGILQITDLGLGRFHRMESRSREDPNSVGGSPTYMPPELVLKIKVSRAYDMWSFGCIFLQFVTWMLEGNAGIQKFADKRMAIADDGIEDDLFFTIRTDSSFRKFATVRPAVTQWIMRLRKHRHNSEMVQDLLDLVQNGMLKVDAAERIKSEPLKEELRRIVQKSAKHSSYMVEPLD